MGLDDQPKAAADPRRQDAGSSNDAARHEDALSEYARDPILLVASDGSILEANRAAEITYGYSRDELLRLNLADLRAPESRAALPGQLQRAWLEGIVFETMHCRRDGSRFAVEVSSQSTTQDGRRVLVNVIRDLSDRRRIEERLEASEAHYRPLFENMREGLAVHDLVYNAEGVPVDYRILEINPAFSSNTGLARRKVVGKLASEAYGVESPPYLEIYAAVVATRRPRSFEAWFAPLERHFAISAFPVGGRQFATVFTDVTERNRVEEQLRNAQKMEAVGRLAGGIAHDFNNLLMVMLAHGEFALETLQAGHPARANIESVMTAAHRAAALTGQLLTFSRKRPVHSEVVDLNEVVAETGGMLKRVLGEDIQLEIVRGRGLKRVRADAGQVTQAILNLAVNARDAMPSGGRLVIETANARLEGDRPGPYVVLTVRDSGVGMTTEVQSHIFEPFFTTKPKGKGTGLGLPMVYGIVKQSGGEIRVRSRPGHGSTFRIYLPAVAEQGPVFDSAEHSNGSRGSERVLLVEDDPQVRRVTIQMLKDLGYEPSAAGDGEEALRLLEDRGESIDVLVSDVVMPGMSGPELADRARVLYPKLPVLFISGYPDAFHSANLRADTLLSKPFTADALGRRMRQLLERE